jgi:hypothetical protein
MRMRSRRFERIGALALALVTCGTTVYALTDQRAADRRVFVEGPPLLLRIWMWGSVEIVPDEDLPPAFVHEPLPLPRVGLAVGEHRRRSRVDATRPTIDSAVVDEPRSGVMARFSAPLAVAAEGEALPAVPQRTDIADVMGSIRDGVQRCYERTMVPGRVTLTLVISGADGRVARIRVSPDTATAQCIAGLARELRFSRFARGQATVEYPYSLR